MLTKEKTHPLKIDKERHKELQFALGCSVGYLEPSKTPGFFTYDITPPQCFAVIRVTVSKLC